MILSNTVKKLRFEMEILFMSLEMCHLLFIYVGVDLKKCIRKRAQIWDSCTFKYFAITMQEA